MLSFGYITSFLNT